MLDTDSMLKSLLNSAYFYLKFRPRSKKEITNHLYKKAKRRRWSSDLVKTVVKQLEEQKLINDKDFIDWFVQQRYRNKPKSQFVLRNELLRFGIAKELIDNYFAKHRQPEEELALQALKLKWRHFISLSPLIRFQKAASFLSRRGFSFDTARKVIEKIEGQSF